MRSQEFNEQFDDAGWIEVVHAKALARKLGLTTIRYTRYSKETRAIINANDREIAIDDWHPKMPFVEANRLVKVGNGNYHIVGPPRS